ncbi:nucleotidyltransferase domain-containing protein [Deinococcus navajonensis]|uniref:Nucleotidyltransferase domain-containing protein n=1 Tax=Deinococcus navajonensis TaxID=309884 RepID=A0ABV8XMF6_9DEIO
MLDLYSAQAALRQGLGDFLARGRPDGVFHLGVGGPGSVPALNGLDLPELHLDLLPGPPNADQRATLRSLGYQPAGNAWVHPGGWRLVLPDPTTGWRAGQQSLRRLLTEDREAAGLYTQRFREAGRQAADEALTPAATAHYAATEGWRPAQFMARALNALKSPWMLAGGVALDLALGEVRRPHDDLDIAVDRTDQLALLATLRTGGWRLDTPTGQGYADWTAPLAPPAHQIHARHAGLPDVLFADFLLTDLSDGVWRYRRDPAVTRPLAEARRWSPDGLPYLAPEIVLLFKSSRAQAAGDVRTKDASDAQRVLPILSAPARNWLREALERTAPDHPWLAQL